MSNIAVTDKNDHDKNPLDPVSHGPEFVKELTNKVKANPYDEESWFALGLEYFENDWKDAVKCFSRCININPFNPEYYFRRGRKYVSMDEWPKALADFTMATRLETEVGPMWHYRGVANFFLEKYEEAIECFMRSIEVNIKYDGDLIPPSVDWAWMAYQKLGRRDDALKVLEYVNEGTKIAKSDNDYKRRVMLYKGIENPDEFYADVNRENDLLGMAEIYGLANYYLYIEGNVKRNVELLEEVLAYKTWHHSFAYKLALIEINQNKAKL